MNGNRDKKGRFIKGHKIDNYGRGRFKNGHLGFLKHTNITSFKTGDDRVTGEKNIRWKGDDVGYDALHDWLKRKYGSPQICEECGVGPKEKGQKIHNIHWANKTGIYNRDLKNWFKLCGSCHKKYDNKRKK